MDEVDAPSCIMCVFPSSVQWTATAFLLAWGLLAGCKKASPSSSNGPPSATTPIASATAAGTGDKSGKSVSNAKALARGAPDTVTLPCDTKVVYGPFAFTRSPQVLTLHGSATSVDGSQLCVGGEWVDSSGKFVAVAGLGCPEGSAATEQDQTIEYSPHNGGSTATPVYYVLKGAEKHGASCSSARVTLSMR